jgi:hypothetical protein
VNINLLAADIVSVGRDFGGFGTARGAVRGAGDFLCEDGREYGERWPGPRICDNGTKEPR